MFSRKCGSCLRRLGLLAIQDPNARIRPLGGEPVPRVGVDEMASEFIPPVFLKKSNSRVRRARLASTRRWGRFLNQVTVIYSDPFLDQGSLPFLFGLPALKRHESALIWHESALKQR